MDIRGQLLKSGVSNLKEFGYPAVDEKNILTDMIYSRFFKSMLEEAIETVQSPVVVKAAEDLMGELKENLE